MGDRNGYEWKDVPANNFVDDAVYNKLKRVKSLPSELCTDAEFIRRVSLDLTGLPPTADDVRSFTADARDARQISAADFLRYLAWRPAWRASSWATSRTGGSSSWGPASSATHGGLSAGRVRPRSRLTAARSCRTAGGRDRPRRSFDT
jgi:hypothetical protein